jgi:hypothetical protein
MGVNETPPSGRDTKVADPTGKLVLSGNGHGAVRVGSARGGYGGREWAGRHEEGGRVLLLPATSGAQPLLEGALTLIRPAPGQ